MHLYGNNHREILTRRARQFDGQVRRFLGGALDGDFFQQLRLRNGLYKERYAHMLRVAIPYGVLNGEQLKKLAHIARAFDKGFGHFTTRQNIQFNWPELADTPEILRQLSQVDMHAIQTSGSCIRNITCDHLAGVAADEITDPRPWCELIRRWSTLHAEFNWLPRKFKIAVTGAEQDRAAIQLHDIGLKVFHGENENDTRFCIYVGGGMGRTPVIGKVIHPSLPAAELLRYVQAILRVYNQFGRRDNKYRARIKILVNDIGIDEFKLRVEEEWRVEKLPALTDAEIENARALFYKPVTVNQPADEKVTAKVIPVADQRFSRWREHNTVAHRDPQYCIVYVSLKAPGAAPGDLTDSQMDALADIAQQYGENEIRVSHEQNLVLPYIKKADLFTVWHALNQLQLATPNIGTLNDMICCPGLDFCSLANAGTLPIARQINHRIAEYEKLYDIGEVKLKMSGCMNACGHHHAGHIGILGVDKKGAEWYQITLGGSAENDTRLGERLGPAVPRDQVAEVIEILLDTYLALRQDGEKFLATVIRIGTEPFKKNVYAQLNENHQKSSHPPKPVAA